MKEFNTLDTCRLAEEVGFKTAPNPMTWTMLHKFAELVREDAFRDLASQVESLQADAARWKYARDYLSIEDVESWSVEMKYVPDEVESLKIDAAVDEARKQS